MRINVLGVEFELTLGLFLQFAGFVVAVISFVMSFMTKRSQKSARLAIELIPKKDGIFIMVKNVGDRIAYSIESIVEPASFTKSFPVIPALGPGTSYIAFICNHEDVPPGELKVKIKYKDPAHRVFKNKNTGKFKLSEIGGTRLSLDTDLNCYRLAK